MHINIGAELLHLVHNPNPTTQNSIETEQDTTLLITEVSMIHANTNSYNL